MKASEWRSQEDSELEYQLAEKKKRLFELRFKESSEEIQDTKEVQKIRRDIARIHTIRRERELAQAAGQPDNEAES